jgi:hypothetical protein
MEQQLQQVFPDVPSQLLYLLSDHLFFRGWFQSWGKGRSGGAGQPGLTDDHSGSWLKELDAHISDIPARLVKAALRNQADSLAHVDSQIMTRGHPDVNITSGGGQFTMMVPAGPLQDAFNALHFSPSPSQPLGASSTPHTNTGTGTGASTAAIRWTPQACMGGASNACDTTGSTSKRSHASGELAWFDTDAHQPHASVWDDPDPEPVQETLTMNHGFLCDGDDQGDEYYDDQEDEYEADDDQEDEYEADDVYLFGDTADDE